MLNIYIKNTIKKILPFIMIIIIININQTFVMANEKDDVTNYQAGYSKINKYTNNKYIFSISDKNINDSLYCDAQCQKNKCDILDDLNIECDMKAIKVDDSIINITTLAEWNNFATNSINIKNKNINIVKDINFSGSNMNTATINKNVIVYGNNKAFIGTSKVLIAKNYGQIVNLNINNARILNNDNANNQGVISYNYGVIKDVNFYKINVVGNNYCGIISENKGIVENIKASKVNVVCNDIAGGLVANNVSSNKNKTYAKRVIKQAIIKNVKLDNIRLKSKRANNNKKYSNLAFNGSKKSYEGDYFGGIVGYNRSAIISNSSINNIRIYADDAIGGIAGINHKSPSINKNAKINDVKVSNIKVYGGKRIGGAVGFNLQKYDSNKYSWISYKGSKYKNLQASINNVNISGEVYIKGYSEVGGIVGINNFARLHNSTFNAKKAKYHVYSLNDEAAGAIGDNEFGYVSNTKTNANSYAKVFQAAGFVADNEGTLKNCIATGNTYSKKEIGGFVASNLGVIYNSKAKGNVYATSSSSVGNFAAYSKKETYKGLTLKGKIIKSSTNNKRYIKNKKVTNLKVA
ncbi:hypothetical protein [Mycoplasma sp. P36-A1]|uniref:hypothetical protein n=1 Tax=Mycoplasma sp. P36-A1 TaxID=3252900 RepID=UPI003C2E9AD8